MINLKNLIKAIIILVAVPMIMQSLATQSQLDPSKEIAPHVVPFRNLVFNKRLATGFHLKYRDKVYIVTNRHVCDSHTNHFRHDNIVFGDYVGEIIYKDPKHDLCLVTSDRDSGLELSEKGVKEMDKIILVGYPRGIGKVVRRGRIIEEKFWSAPWLNGLYIRSYQISAMAYGGNSGSPVVNEEGKVIGVLFAGSPMFPSEPFIVPFLELKDFLERAHVIADLRGF